MMISVWGLLPAFLLGLGIGAFMAVAAVLIAFGIAFGGDR